MQPLPRGIVDRFADEFAGTNPRLGFSAAEITEYFRRYSRLIRANNHYGMNLSRRDLFIESVYSLPPKHQYYSLNDLAFFVYQSKYQYPSEETRNQLRQDLHANISDDPIGLTFSQIRETAFREDWVTCYSRLRNNPAACITSSRTMIETILRTIISERGEAPDKSGELGRLVKQAQGVLGFNRPNRQPEHQLMQGLSSVINGICSISNSAGDRHGLIGGDSIDDPYYAQLCMNAAGTLGLAFIEMHLLHNPCS